MRERTSRLVLAGARELVVREQLAEPPGHATVAIAVERAGICGSDLMHYRYTTNEISIGHELLGRVIAVGPGTSNALEGAPVTVRTTRACGRCEACEHGLLRACRGWSRLALDGFADQICVPIEHVIPLPDAREVMVLVEPMYVALDLVDKIGDATGGRVLLMGCGPIALLALHVLRDHGAAVTAVVRDRSTKRSELAQRWGAMLAASDDLALGEHQDRYDAAIVTAPYETIPSVLPSLRRGGVVVYNGIDPPRRHVTLDVLALHTRRIELRPSFPHPQLDFQRAIERVRTHAQALGEMITHVFGLDHSPQAFEALDTAQRDIVKAVIAPLQRRM